MNTKLRDSTMRTICLDFDGVLYNYQGWVEPPSYLPEGPVEGAVDFCHKMAKEFNLVVCSARFKYPGVLESAISWLDKHGFPEMELTCEKPLAFVYIDDRAIVFDGTFPSLHTLKTFLTWQEKARLDALLQE